jgi:alpha-glucosidase
MKKVVPPDWRPLSGLDLAGTAAQSATAASPRGRVELSALAPDLFRLRMTAARHFSPPTSGAVCPKYWSALPVKVHTSKTRVALQTAAGELSLLWANAGWMLRDLAGNQLLSAIGSESGHGGQGWRVTLALGQSEAIFGLGETTGTFNKRGLIREFWNTDVLGHAPAIHPSLRALYLSIPFACVLRDGRAAGLFWDNPSRQTWDLGQTQRDRWRMTAAGGDVDLYLFLGPEVRQVVERYTELTGRMPLPPRWALGYQQCRYSYPSRRRVEQVAHTFRARSIPCDALYLDIDHLDDHRVFTFGKTFPKPPQMIRKLASQGFKIVCIADPGVKDDPRYGVLKRGRALNAFVKKPNRRADFIGKVWPGPSRWPDFLNAEVRRWWGREQSQLLDVGIAGIWNDMNEPAVFDSPTKTLPEDCLHRGDLGPARHADAHNLYGSQMARASRDGALAHQPDRRPFIITRAGYAGVQRHAVVWTGDNTSSWEHLADSVQMCLNLSLSGVPFCGADVGGFLDNTAPELLIRWTQMAAFTPLFRNHSNKGTIDQEPWALGPTAEAICRRYIELRYQFLPYLYVLLAEAHRTGAPIMRPLLWHYATDPVAVATGDQFLLGPDLLVAPILRQGAVARSVYLPQGTWFDFWTGRRYPGRQHIVAPGPLEIIPLFVRAGAILPMGPVQQYVGENEPGIINLHVWPAAPGELPWYEDDGTSNSYAAGNCSERKITFTPKRRGGQLRWQPSRGSFASQVRIWRVIFRGLARRLGTELNGRRIDSRWDRESALLTLELPNSPQAISLRVG